MRAPSVALSIALERDGTYKANRCCERVPGMGWDRVLWAPSSSCRGRAPSEAPKEVARSPPTEESNLNPPFRERHRPWV